VDLIIISMKKSTMIPPDIDEETRRFLEMVKWIIMKITVGG
jgi:hypothetical protein